MRQILFAALASALCFSVIATSPAKAADIPRDPDRLVFPLNYAKKDRWPLVVVLHAFKVNGTFEEVYFGLDTRMNLKDGFVLLEPGSVKDPQGHRIWNSADYCCNHYGLPVDDVDYLYRLITKTRDENKIDPSRVYLLGQSNGAIMAQRMMCDHSELFAAVVSFAGAGQRLESQCQLNTPTSFLEIHAIHDKTMAYEGPSKEFLEEFAVNHHGAIYPYTADPAKLSYASAPKNVAFVASKNGCDPASLEKLPRRKLLVNIHGKDTSPEHYTRCRGGVEVGLWTLERGGHVPTVTPAFKTGVVNFLLSKTKVK